MSQRWSEAPPTEGVPLSGASGGVLLYLRSCPLAANRCSRRASLRCDSASRVHGTTHLLLPSRHTVRSRGCQRVAESVQRAAGGSVVPRKKKDEHRSSLSFAVLRLYAANDPSARPTSPSRSRLSARSRS